MWKPSMIPFSPFVSTDFLLSSCPWDEIFLIFYHCLSVNSNSEAFVTIPITTIRFHPLVCCIHILKVALSFSPETIHSNHSYPVVCRIPPPQQYTFVPKCQADGCKKSHPPSSAAHSSCALLLLLHSVFSTIPCTYITSSSAHSSSSMARCALGMRSVPKHCFG